MRPPGAAISSAKSIWVVEIPSQQWQSVGLQRSGDWLRCRPTVIAAWGISTTYWFCTRNCGAGRPQVGLCPADLVLFVFFFSLFFFCFFLWFFFISFFHFFRLFFFSFFHFFHFLFFFFISFLSFVSFIFFVFLFISFLSFRSFLSFISF